MTILAVSGSVIDHRSMNIRNWRRFMKFQRYFKAIAKKAWGTIMMYENDLTELATFPQRLSRAASSPGLIYG